MKMSLVRPIDRLQFFARCPAYFLAFSIPLSQFISSRFLLVAFVLVILIHRQFTHRLVRKTIDVLIYFFVAIIGLLYSANLEEGLRSLETGACFLAIPLVFNLIHPFTTKELRKILAFFAFGVTFSCLICIVNAFVSYSGNASFSYFFFHEFTNIIDFQPTYFANYLVFSITFALYSLSYDEDFLNSRVVIFSTLFFFFVLMLSGGKTSFMSLLLVFSFFILRFFLDGNKKIYAPTISLIIAMMICMFFVTFYESGSRTLILNDSWDRYDLWKSAIFANENVLFGVGTGDYKVVLNEYFISHSMEKYAFDSMNSHNQFIQSYLSNGLLGLLAIIFLLGRPLYLSFIRGYTFGILVFFPFLLYGMTEVFLGRYQGVVFFAFLHQAFISYLDSSKPTIDLKRT
jgi:O-antigen ligase